MEVIIKPTGRCNFACEFCSAGLMDTYVKHPTDGKVQKSIIDFLDKTKDLTGIIITGGDPLMLDPSYYYELYNRYHVHISATTNLKDFYFNPEKWAPLFHESWFDVCTSFNYGTRRRWDKDTPYTEEMFLKVMDKWKEYVGPDVPSFLAVIDKYNEDTVIDHVLLAKRLNTQVKLNGAIACGRESESYPRYKMFQWYTKIIDMGLGDYESYCSDRFHSRCPRNIDLSCLSTIRCIYEDLEGNIHVGTCDEQISLGIEIPKDTWYPNSCHQEKIKSDEFIHPDKCAYCELFRLCNGCKTNRIISKKIPEYCDEMKKLEEKIIEQGWLL